MESPHKDISFFQIIWTLIIYVVLVIIFPIRLLHSVFKRDKDGISTRPVVMIPRPMLRKNNSTTT